jgi:hypothetical protein
MKCMLNNHQDQNNLSPAAAWTAAQNGSSLQAILHACMARPILTGDTDRTNEYKCATGKNGSIVHSRVKCLVAAAGTSSIQANI